MKTSNCLGALLALFLASCATDSDHSSDAAKKVAMQAEKAAAMEGYNNCVIQAARRLDDGSSNPSLIALAIEPECKDQFSRYVKASGTGMDSSSFAKFSESLEYNQTDLTAEIVQKMRSQQTERN